jgi:type II restriction enzyme
MASLWCGKALEEAWRQGAALLKFISANDAGSTGSHQRGYYLPKPAWRIYAPQPPTLGINDDHEVEVEWFPRGCVTRSCVKWYGRAKQEYRLTRFGGDFPYLTDGNVGDLLILIPRGDAQLIAFVLDDEEDVETVQAQLGVDIVKSWAVFGADAHTDAHTEDSDDEKIDAAIWTYAGSLSEFPCTDALAGETQQVIAQYFSGFERMTPDALLLRLLKTEYLLYQLVERQLCTPEIARLFRSVDEFLKTANSILQRRKSRAGRSMEHHCRYVLARAGLPFDAQPAIDGAPDLIIPSAAAYNDLSFPTENIFVVGIKRTCKDRWRQVIREGQRIKAKYLITIQNGISLTQLRSMEQLGVTLIVPKPLHKEYPSEFRPRLLSVAGFIDRVKSTLGS